MSYFRENRFTFSHRFHRILPFESVNYLETSHQYKQEEYQSRKLTNEEIAILQGFPGDYKFAGNKQSITRQIGNAVPSQIVAALFAGINTL